VCYSGTIIDVLDNVKIVDGTQSPADLALSPTVYSSPRELTVPIALDRLHPLTKAGHVAWASERESFGKTLIPGEFSGKRGKKETIGRPAVLEGAIVCGLVSSSPAYNARIMSVDRKVLAIETESGGLFSVAQQYRLPAITIRGISDYAGIDKNDFEQETANNARKLAISNAASFLVRHLGLAGMLAYLEKVSMKRAGNDSQLSLLPTAPEDTAARILIQQGEDFNSKLRDLAPGYSLQSKGYRLPVPRIRTLDIRSGAPQAGRHGNPTEVRDALRDARIITLYVPRQYPDLSLSWIIANDLLSAQLGGCQLVPSVVEARSLQRPRFGLAQLIAPQVLRLTNSPEFVNVFIIDDFNFESKTRLDFLREQIEAWPNAKFIVVTRNHENILLQTEFTGTVASSMARLCDISFMEITSFIQKNFDMPPRLLRSSQFDCVRLFTNMRFLRIRPISQVFPGAR
jgi:hypothetical protein